MEIGICDIIQEKPEDSYSKKKMFNWPVKSGGGFTFNFNIELLNLDLKIFTIQCDLILKQ